MIFTNRTRQMDARTPRHLQLNLSPRRVFRSRAADGEQRRRTQQGTTQQKIQTNISFHKQTGTRNWEHHWTTEACEYANNGDVLSARTAYEMNEGARSRSAVRRKNCQPASISDGGAAARMDYSLTAG